jgi:hypothetical protein
MRDEEVVEYFKLSPISPRAEETKKIPEYEVSRPEFKRGG